MAWVPFVVVSFIFVVDLFAYCCNENSWPARRLSARGKWRSLLAVSNRVDGIGRQQKPSTYWGLELLDPAHCVTACAPQWVLLALRLLALPYFAAFFFVDRFGYNSLGSDWLTFFTNWSFVLFALSMLLGAAHTAAYMLDSSKQRQQLQQQRNPLLEPGSADAVGAAAGPVVASASSAACDSGSSAGAARWSLLAKAHLFTVEVAYPAELFLTVFYWAVLYDGDADMGSTVMVHGINNLWMLADVALSRLPFCSYHYLVLLLYGSVYLVFMWIYQAASGEWPYSTLDWNKGSSLVYYAVLPLLLALAFFCYLGVAVLRERLMWRQHAQQAQRQGQAQQEAELGKMEAPASDAEGA